MFDKEFKLAISNLPSKEKDKLILRLLKKDLYLANRLYFELVSTDSIDERRIEIEEYIKRRAIRMTESFYSPGTLMMDMRELSGRITDHVKITKDKYGEASLNLLLINETLKGSIEKIEKSSTQRARKFCIYIIAKIFKILIMINSFHEDLRIDFSDALTELQERFAKSERLMDTAIYHGLDMNWARYDEIPENIKDIHKDLRERGYLK